MTNVWKAHALVLENSTPEQAVADAIAGDEVGHAFLAQHFSCSNGPVRGARSHKVRPSVLLTFIYALPEARTPPRDVVREAFPLTNGGNGEASDLRMGAPFLARDIR
ncbi:hypothetical protein BN946_scf184998.g57 [Trametes cinnabarina]|uniref:Uncharacterized protein n=1 Tax=Pycnoporus cinnabarinus TaxID=5643 RepID=A0A060S2M5_PYCCI|nr:hypothetical protein BN946_scf184998.g57 [Trametes cinnabarina]